MRPVLTPQQTVHGLCDSYTVERPIGTGGFGHTFLARRRSDGLAVNLKVLRIDRMADWKALELFEREARALASLDHPNIPRHHEYFAFDGQQPLPPTAIGELDETPGSVPELQLVLVQDYIPGRSLKQLIDEGLQLDGARVRELLRALLEVLVYLHGLHPPLVHRDIKPSNIIITPEGRPYLIDFGAIQTRVQVGTSMGSTNVGTFGYFPMEQIMGKAGPASDLYSLSMTMLVTVTGAPPERLPLDERTGKIGVHEVAPQLDARLQATLDAMLEPIVGNRLPNAQTALDFLDGKLPARAPSGPGLTPLRPRALSPSESLPHLRRSDLQWLWAAAIGLGGLGAGLVYIVFFDALSETQLVRVSPLWLTPIVFGVGGITGENHRSRHPLASAFMWAGIGSILLIAFIYGIFPTL